MAHPTGYTRTQIRLHWIVVLLIALQYILHETIAEAWESWLDGAEVGFDPLIAQHVLMGGLVAVLVVWRLALRLTHGAPPPPEEEHPALKLAAHATHWAFYALMLLLPVSGGVAWFGGVEAAAEAHEAMKTLLLLLIVLHVAAALVHQFIFKTNLMARMKRPVG
ncbi:MAG: cytochrome b/b6 domain-containing protein [Roseicyclus sp.]|jgi:cytochrome b561|nr:cytochrome b/b6 domain-containing protein [Roseicyclus sp.]